jgi:hypothetical protein
MDCAQTVQTAKYDEAHQSNACPFGSFICHHWRGITQIAIAIGAGVAILACTAATAGICGAIIGGVAGGLTYATTSGPHTWLGAGIAVAGGALSGGLAGIMSLPSAAFASSGAYVQGAAILMATQGTIGGLQYIATAAASGDKPSLKDLGEAFGLSALNGLPIPAKFFGIKEPEHKDGGN